MNVPPADGSAASAVKPRRLLSRDFLFLLSARFLWLFAHHALVIAVSYIIYDVTKSALALGFVGLAAFAPKLLLSIVSGVVADRYDRRVVLASCMVVNVLAAIGLFFVAIQPVISVEWIYVFFMLLGLARGFAGPASQALIANSVPRDQLSQGVSLASSTQQFAVIAGPAAGGALLVAGHWMPFAVAIVFFAAGAILIQMMRPLSPNAKSRKPPTLADAFAGVVFVWKRPILLGSISLDLFSVLLGGAVALLPVIASDILHVGSVGLGILRSMIAVGAIMMGLFLAHTPPGRRVGVKLFVTVVIFGLATVGLGLSTNFYLSAAFLWIIGASDMLSVVIRSTLVQSDTPDDMRGRVAAVNNLFVGASNELGEFESGITAWWFGLVPAILLGGFGTVGICLLWAVIFPELLRRDTLLQSKPS